MVALFQAHVKTGTPPAFIVHGIGPTLAADDRLLSPPFSPESLPL